MTVNQEKDVPQIQPSRSPSTLTEMTHHQGYCWVCKPDYFYVVGDRGREITWPLLTTSLLSPSIRQCQGNKLKMHYFFFLLKYIQQLYSGAFAIRLLMVDVTKSWKSKLTFQVSPNKTSDKPRTGSLDLSNSQSYALWFLQFTQQHMSTSKIEGTKTWQWFFT